MKYLPKSQKVGFVVSMKDHPKFSFYDAITYIPDKDKIELANLLKNHPDFDFIALLNSADGHNKCSLALALKDLPQFDIPVALALMPTDTCKLQLAEGLKDRLGAEGLMEYVKKFHPQGIARIRDEAALNTKTKGPDVPEPKAPDDLLLTQGVAPR